MDGILCAAQLFRAASGNAAYAIALQASVKCGTAEMGNGFLQEKKEISAIQSCRTAALGGHVEGCDDCGHMRIAYNSCRNRHCPKCQGAAARTWLAEREADLLPVGY